MHWSRLLILDSKCQYIVDSTNQITIEAHLCILSDLVFEPIQFLELNLYIQVEP
jgi:hypothetical protein